MDYSSASAAEAAGRDPYSFANTKWKGYMPNAAPQQPAPQASQASPYKAPDMAAYSSASFTPPQGARANNLSGQVPSNQMWAQAYNQASNQYGGNTQAQSWTMPGSYSSQGYNPTTGQSGQATGGQSWDGNMAYQSIDSRPGPITATATGVNGQSMPWQDTLTQREAFAGNLSQRLGQYSSGQLTGPPTFNANQLMSQANDQLAKGTFYNPFSQQNPDVQRVMENSAQYATGTQWQNPFGNSPQANTPKPSLSQATYDPGKQSFGNDVYMPVQPPAPKPPAQQPLAPMPARPTLASPPQDDFQQFLEQRGMMDDYRSWTAGRAQPVSQPTQAAQDGQGEEAPAKPPMRPRGGVSGGVKHITPVNRRPARWTEGRARPIPPPSQGTPYGQSEDQPADEDKVPVRPRGGVSGGVKHIVPVSRSSPGRSRQV